MSGVRTANCAKPSSISGVHVSSQLDGWKPVVSITPKISIRKPACGKTFPKCFRRENPACARDDVRLRSSTSSMEATPSGQRPGDERRRALGTAARIRPSAAKPCLGQFQCFDWVGNMFRDVTQYNVIKKRSSVLKSSKSEWTTFALGCRLRKSSQNLAEPSTSVNFSRQRGQYVCHDTYGRSKFHHAVPSEVSGEKP